MTTLTEEHRVNFVLTESNLVYPQTGNGSCPGSSSYVHNHVVKGMLNGDLGEVLNFTSDNNVVTKNVNYTLPVDFVAENCDLNIFTWKNVGNISTQNLIAQSKYTSVDNPTNIGNTNTIANEYKLNQNYPNPFNPSTNIVFSVPRSGNVSLKFYDMLGNEVASYIDNDFLAAGTYNATFDGAGLPSGVYFYTLSTSDFSETKKMILTK